MRCSLSEKELGCYIGRQLSNFFPDGNDVDVAAGIPDALSRLDVCLSAVYVSYARRDGEVWFDHFHSDHYAMFLYLLARVLHEKGESRRVCDKLYCLNKALHSVDIYYAVELPRIFYFSHPVGTVLGRAVYGDYLHVYQGCTVGGSENGAYPVIGNHVTLFAGAYVIGNCRLGNNVKVGARAFLLNQDLADNSTYIGFPPNGRTLPNARADIVWDSSFVQMFQRRHPGLDKDKSL